MRLIVDRLCRVSVVFSQSDIVCIVIGGINWLASDDNILLSVDLDSLLFNQDGLLDHARLGLLDNGRLRQGNDVLLARLLGLLGLLELLSVLDLFLLALKEDRKANDTDDQSSNEIGNESAVENNLGLSITTRVVCWAIGVIFVANFF